MTNVIQFPTQYNEIKPQGEQICTPCAKKMGGSLQSATKAFAKNKCNYCKKMVEYTTEISNWQFPKERPSEEKMA